MTSPTLSVQINALCFIFLLAGNDAARIREGSQTAEVAARLSRQLTGQSTGPAETQWQNENAACSYRWGTGCVGGTGCEYRRLPLDRTYSQSCRLSDDHMLLEPTRFINMHTDVLGAKSAKFADKCPGTSWYDARGTARCTRRAMHIMRSMEFISKAQTASVMGNLSEAELAHHNEVHQQALSKISGVLGEDGALILELQQKMKANPALIRSDPQTALTELVSIVAMLVKGSDEEKEEARIAIRAMTASGPEDAEATAEDDAKTEELARKLEENAAEIRQMLDEKNDIEGVMNMTGGDGGGALLQLEAAMENGEVEPSAIILSIVFVLIVFLLWHTIVAVIMAVLSVLFMLVFISLVGCGLASAFPSQSGVQCARLSGVATIVRCETQCARRFLRVPFQYASTGLHQLAGLFSPAELG